MNLSCLFFRVLITSDVWFVEAKTNESDPRASEVQLYGYRNPSLEVAGGWCYSFIHSCFPSTLPDCYFFTV